MNKFSLLFIAFVFFGGIIASNTGDVQKQEAPVVTSASTVPAQAVGEQASAPSSDPAVVFKKKEPLVDSSVDSSFTVPAPAPVEQDKEALSVSKVDKLKLFLGGCLFYIKQAGSTAKYYILGDVLTDWFAKKGYIATPDAGLINAYINGVTPRRIVNYVALIALVNAAYFGYKAFAKDQNQDDFCLDDEDENLY